MVRIKERLIQFILILFIFLFPYKVFSQKSDDTEWKTNLFRLLEVTRLSSGTGGPAPESIGSLLSSMRLVNSLNTNSGELYKDRQKTTEQTSSSRIRLSQRLSEWTYLGLTYTSHSKINYERETFGNKGSALYDNTTVSNSSFGARIGIGPMDYFRTLSFEFSIGYDSSNQNGPFQSNGFRFPRIENGNLRSGSFLLGTGFIDYKSKSWSLSYGVSASGDTFGIYLWMDTQYALGDVKLNSISIYPQSTVTSTLQNNLFGRNDLQLASLRYKNVYGINFLFEMGMIIKFTDYVGLKLGGYYQVSALSFTDPSGYYYENGKWDEVKSSAIITSSTKRNQTGYYGFSFGIITKI